ncbi:AHH domain-containing protein, partial [Aquibacillus rhizosphaerae]
IVGWGGRLARSGKGIYSTVKVSNTALDAYKSAKTFDNIRKSELGLYGLASSNGFSEYITGKDILGNELTEAQRTASLGLGLAGILPLTPALASNTVTLSKQTIAKAQEMARGSRDIGRATLQGMIDSLQPNRMTPDLATVGGPMNVVNMGPLRQKVEDTYSLVVKGIDNANRLIPGTPGVVTGGNSNKLGKNMLEDMGLKRSTKWSGYQAQHIIPSEMANNSIIQKIGMNFDNSTNGIFLRVPDNDISTMSRHRGYHSVYNEVVERALNRMDINQNVDNLQKQVYELQSNLRKLQEKGLPLYPSQGATVELWERKLKQLEK